MAGVKGLVLTSKTNLTNCFIWVMQSLKDGKFYAGLALKKLPNLFGQAFLNNGHLGFDDGDCPAINIVRCDGTTATQKYILIRSDRIQDLTEFSE